MQKIITVIETELFVGDHTEKFEKYIKQGYIIKQISTTVGHYDGDVNFSITALLEK